jgi:site-specific DNA-methyltransferase (adenine-specific)
MNTGYTPNKKGKNPGNIWNIANKCSNLTNKHHAVFPTKLVEKCLKAGCIQNGIVLDIFSGLGTTGIVCKKLKLDYIGIELSAIYNKIAKKRIQDWQNE